VAEGQEITPSSWG